VAHSASQSHATSSGTGSSKLACASLCAPRIRGFSSSPATSFPIQTGWGTAARRSGGKKRAIPTMGRRNADSPSISARLVRRIQ